MKRTFNVAGSSNLNGRRRFRVGKNKYRKTTLLWHGHTNVKLVELPKPMTQVEAYDWLKANHPSVVRGITPPVEPKAQQVTERKSLRASKTRSTRKRAANE